MTQILARISVLILVLTVPPIAAAAEIPDDPILGKAIPHVSLESSMGGKVELPGDILGKWTLIYFYPKDDTPGCTKEACNYRDRLDRFQKLGVLLYGVSLDDLQSHDEFARKFHLNFPLLVDSRHELSSELGVYGKTAFGTGLSRDTFLVDPRGIVRRVWRKVSPSDAADVTFKAVESFITAPPLKN